VIRDNVAWLTPFRRDALDIEFLDQCQLCKLYDALVGDECGLGNAGAPPWGLRGQPLDASSACGELRSLSGGSDGLGTASPVGLEAKPFESELAAEVTAILQRLPASHDARVQHAVARAYARIISAGCVDNRADAVRIVGSGCAVEAVLEVCAAALGAHASVDDVALPGAIVFPAPRKTSLTPQIE
ncbi:unnamed protein product, partial [Prorocentrum cordatum]